MRRCLQRYLVHVSMRCKKHREVEPWLS
jgi:hypothetical protein